MDKLKFLLALQVLLEENKKQKASDHNSGYAKALYDVMQVIDLCNNEHLTPTT
jgi:hypothetical protein